MKVLQDIKYIVTLTVAAVLWILLFLWVVLQCTSLIVRLYVFIYVSYC